MCVSEIFEEYIDCICLRARMIMAFGAIMTIIPLRQLLKKDPKQRADGTHVLRAFN
jgi:predicted aconitase with swiveling domain